MKLFTLFFACSLGLAHASESYAQKAIVNVEVQNKTVGEILKEIEKQSEFDFFFDNTLIDLNRRVSVTSRNGDIFKVLEKVFKGTKLLQKSEMRKNMVMDLIYRGFIYAANYSESHYNPRRSQIKTELRYLFVTTPNR